MIRNLTQVANAATTITLVICTAVLLTPVAGCKKNPQERYAAFLSNGKSQLNKKDYERAILEFRNATVQQPKSAEVQYQLGLAYLGLKDSRSAVVAFWRALEADPKYTAAELKLAQLASMSSDPAELREAEKHLRKVLQTSGNDPDALNTLAVTQWRLGNNQEAEQLFSKVIAENPKALNPRRTSQKSNSRGRMSRPGPFTASATASMFGDHSAPSWTVENPPGHNPRNST